MSRTLFIFCVFSSLFFTYVHCLKKHTLESYSVLSEEITDIKEIAVSEYKGIKFWCEEFNSINSCHIPDAYASYKKGSKVILQTPKENVVFPVTTDAIFNIDRSKSLYYKDSKSYTTIDEEDKPLLAFFVLWLKKFLKSYNENDNQYYYSAKNSDKSYQKYQNNSVIRKKVDTLYESLWNKCDLDEFNVTFN